MSGSLSSIPSLGAQRRAGEGQPPAKQHVEGLLLGLRCRMRTRMAYLLPSHHLGAPDRPDAELLPAADALAVFVPLPE